jgi:hypothetical protein
VFRPIVKTRQIDLVHEQCVMVIFRKVTDAQHASLPIKLGVVRIVRVATASPHELLFKVVPHLGTHRLIGANRSR